MLDPTLERMMEAVHRYEGTVNQVMGDGIMALFGAPLAHEGHGDEAKELITRSLRLSLFASLSGFPTAACDVRQFRYRGARKRPRAPSRLAPWIARLGVGIETLSFFLGDRGPLRTGQSQYDFLPSSGAVGPPRCGRLDNPSGLRTEHSRTKYGIL